MLRVSFVEDIMLNETARRKRANTIRFHVHTLPRVDKFTDRNQSGYQGLGWGLEQRGVTVEWGQGPGLRRRKSSGGGWR